MESFHSVGPNMVFLSSVRACLLWHLFPYIISLKHKIPRVEFPRLDLLAVFGDIGLLDRNNGEGDKTSLFIWED